MTSPHGESGPDQHASPVSALSPQTYTDGNDRDANAPEAVGAAMSPSTFVASPATDYSYPQTVTSSHADGTDEGAKEVLAFDKSEKIAAPTAYEYHNSPYPQVVGGQNEAHGQGDDEERSAGGAPAKSGKEPQATILGLKRRNFFILLIVAFVIIAVAVGGGVGGALASKKSNSSSGATDPTTNESSSTSSSTTTPTPTPSASPSSTSSSAPSSTATFLNQTNTDSGHFFQGFSKPNMTGEHTSIVSEVDGADFAFDVRSYQFIARNTNCCLSFCTNATREGWLGYVCESKTQSEAKETFSRVFVWCSDKRTVAVARGRCAE